MDTMRLHELFLYPAVRVFAEKAAGSGTIIYSKEDPESKGEYITLCLTNEHVIDDLLEVRKDWHSLLKRNVDKEFLKRGHVEVFSYIKTSLVDSSNRYNCDVIAYDKHQDLARALYWKEKGWLMGVPSRITGIQIGFGFDVTTWMGFSAHPERLYEFLEEQELKFIYDSSDTYKAAIERRKEKEKQALLALRGDENANEKVKWPEKTE